VYQTVFSVEEQSIAAILYWLALFILAIVVCNLWLRERVALWIRRAAVLTIALVALIVTGATYHDVADSRNWSKAVASGTCHSVEGVVSVLQREEPHGRREKIAVGGRVFEFSYFTRSASYHLPLAYGGVLADGVDARICAVGDRMVRVDLKR
jgi:hypothetical protein